MSLCSNAIGLTLVFHALIGCSSSAAQVEPQTSLIDGGSDRSSLYQDADAGKVGLISAFSTGGANPSYAVSGLFRTMAAHPYECPSTKMMGACALELCSSSASPTMQPQAGDVTVSGGGLPVTVSPGADGAYPYHLTPGTLFMGGEKLNFSALGGDVPAFAGSLTAPKPVTLTLPDLSSDGGAPLLVERATSLSVAWSGESTGIVRVLLSTPMSDTLVNCRFDAGAKTGVMPRELLADFPAGAGFLAFFEDAEQEVTAGDWRVLLIAELLPTTPAALARVDVNVQ